MVYKIMAGFILEYARSVQVEWSILEWTI